MYIIHHGKTTKICNLYARGDKIGLFHQAIKTRKRQEKGGNKKQTTNAMDRKQLHVNGLNTPFTKQGLSMWNKKTRPHYMLLIENSL